MNCKPNIVATTAATYHYRDTPTVEAARYAGDGRWPFAHPLDLLFEIHAWSKEGQTGLLMSVTGSSEFLGDADSIMIEPGQWIVLDEHGRLYVYDDKDFRRVFEPEGQSLENIRL